MDSILVEPRDKQKHKKHNKHTKRRLHTEKANRTSEERDFAPGSYFAKAISLVCNTSFFSVFSGLNVKRFVALVLLLWNGASELMLLRQDVSVKMFNI